MINVSTIRKLVSYDPDTGSMTWLVTKGRCVKGREVGNPHSCGYRETHIGGHRIYVHRLVWLYHYGKMPGGQIDHINGDRSDNRIKNLRAVTQQQNSANMRMKSNNKSGYKGVTKYGNRYIAHIHISGKTSYLGSYDTPVAAHGAYARAAQRAFGDYHRSG